MKRKTPSRLRSGDMWAILGRTVLGLLYLWGHGVLASLMLHVLYRRIGWTAPELLGFTFLFLLSVVVILGEGKILLHFHRPRRDDPFVQLAEAFGKIARGDYDIDLNIHDGHGHFDRLVGGLNEMTDSLRQAEEMRQNFISDMSHEIQSPLTSIRGFARILKEEELEPDKRRDYLEIIEDESLRLSRLSEDLLSMTRLESPDLMLSLRDYRLDRQIREVVLHYEPQWREKNQNVLVDLSEETIRADRDLLVRVWNNLFHNAVKFTPPGGEISFSLRPGDRFLTVTLSNEGAGVPREELPFIFDRFHKADKARSRSDRETGSGLGLSIAGKIVSAHGGEICAESEGPGKGAVFTVILPFSPDR